MSDYGALHDRPRRISELLSTRSAPRRRARRVDRIGDRALRALCLVASLLAAVVIFEIGYQLVTGSLPAVHRFGLGFLTGSEWRPNFDIFGAATLIYGSAVSSAMALVLAMPIAISIGLYLSLLAPRAVRGVVGPMVEMLAAIPSVIVGFWGILVLGPLVQAHIEPGLHGALGALAIFGPQQTSGSSVFTAGLVLTIMIVPIIASVSRDIFLTVPRELQDAAAALGATRWETVRGVVLPATSSGIVAAAVLALGRALGEAIAVTQVIGAGNAIHASLFATGDTLASRIANQFAGVTTELHKASLFYLAVILLAFGLITNLVAQLIVKRFAQRSFAI
jgi:phosphate transport system permease protein